MKSLKLKDTHVKLCVGSVGLISQRHGDAAYNF